MRPRVRLSVQTGGRAQRYENYFAPLRFISGENGEIVFLRIPQFFAFQAMVSISVVHENALFVVYSVFTLFCCVVAVR